MEVVVAGDMADMPALNQKLRVDIGIVRDVADVQNPQLAQLLNQLQAIDAAMPPVMMTGVRGGHPWPADLQASDAS